jgi:hypothetical protein
VDPVLDALPLRKCGNAEPESSGSVSRNSDHQTTEAAYNNRWQIITYEISHFTFIRLISAVTLLNVEGGNWAVMAAQARQPWVSHLKVCDWWRVLFQFRRPKQIQEYPPVYWTRRMQLRSSRTERLKCSGLSSNMYSILSDSTRYMFLGTYQDEKDISVT